MSCASEKCSTWSEKSFNRLTLSWFFWKTFFSKECFLDTDQFQVDVEIFYGMLLSVYESADGWPIYLRGKDFSCLNRVEKKIKQNEKLKFLQHCDLIYFDLTRLMTRLLREMKTITQCLQFHSGRWKRNTFSLLHYFGTSRLNLLLRYLENESSRLFTLFRYSLRPPILALFFIVSILLCSLPLHNMCLKNISRYEWRVKDSN